MNNMISNRLGFRCAAFFLCGAALRLVTVPSLAEKVAVPFLFTGQSGHFDDSQSGTQFSRHYRKNSDCPDSVWIIWRINETTAQNARHERRRRQETALVLTL